MTAGPPDEARSRLPRWWLPAALLFVAARLLNPYYIDNETGYALGPIRVLQPEFFSTHPFLGRFNPFFWVFDLAAAPFYAGMDWLWATLLLRVLIWVFQLWTLSRLGRTLGLAPWAILLVLVLWLNVEQTLVAGEWIIGCASGKPLAYGFLFLALDALLRQRPARAGVFAGLATCFHVLVGGWATMALGGAVLLSTARVARWRTMLRFGGPAAAISLVGLAPGLREVLAGSPPGSDPAVSARLYVEWFNSYHVDPAYFMSPGEYVKIVAWAALTIGAVLLVARRPHRSLLTGFLTFAGLIFAAGLIARRLEWWGVLKYYPFRVADGVYPLAFWMGIAGAIQLAVARAGRPGWALVAASLPFASLVRYASHDLDPRGNRDPDRPTLGVTLLRSEPRMTAYWVRETGREWLAFLRGEPQDDLDPVLAWIRTETPQDAVFIIPPWRDDFMLRARRAEFVSSKTPVVERIGEFKARLDAVNGQPITTNGRAIFRDLRRNYPALTSAQLRAAAERFGADYVLTPTDYTDLPLVHQAGPWRLYAFSGTRPAATGPGPTRSLDHSLASGAGRISR